MDEVRHVGSGSEGKWTHGEDWDRRDPESGVEVGSGPGGPNDVSRGNKCRFPAVVSLL